MDLIANDKSLILPRDVIPSRARNESREVLSCRSPVLSNLIC